MGWDVLGMMLYEIDHYINHITEVETLYLYQVIYSLMLQH